MLLLFDSPSCIPVLHALRVHTVLKAKIAKLIKPQHMHEGLSVTMLAATYLVYVSKVRRCTISCRLCIVWTSLKTFYLGDMVLFACHGDQ